MCKAPARWAMMCWLACSVISGDLRAQPTLRVGMGAAANSGDVVDIPLFVSSEAPVAGLTIVFQWDGRKADGEDLFPASGPGEPLEGADVIEMRVEDDFIVLSAVIDLDGQGPDVIPAGEDIRVGTARIRCDCPGDRQDIILALPPRSTRSLVEGGAVVNNMLLLESGPVRPGDGLQLINGLLTCNALEGPVDGAQVTCGDVDENGNLLPLEGAPGEDVSLCFFYRADVTDDPTERVQGFSLSVSYDCALSCKEDTVDIMGTVLEEVEAEFLQVTCDNDPADGDGCELIAGMLVDLMPPFDGRTLPGTESFRPLFCVDFTIAEDAACGSTLGVDFVDGLNGRGVVPTVNLVAINNFDAPLDAVACEVNVAPSAEDALFLRGDCNFNKKVNVADAAATISHLFLAGDLSFDPPCLDACDADDSGMLEVPDVVFLLNFLFVPGSEAPPAPGPVTEGPDPTEDDLDCGAGDAVCP